MILTRACYFLAKLYPDWKSTDSLLNCGVWWLLCGLFLQTIWNISGHSWVSVSAAIALVHGIIFILAQVVIRLRDKKRSCKGE